MSTKAAPQNLAAERAVLAAMLTDPAALPRAAACLTPGAFYRRGHAIVFEAACAMHAHGEPVDLVTLAAHLEAGGLLEQAGGAATLAALTAEHTSSANLEAHARMVRRAHAARERQKIGATLMDGTDPAQARDLLARLARIEQDAEGTDDPAERWAALGRSGSDLITADLPRLPSFLGDGLLPAGELLFLTGHSGVGKTFLTVQIMSALSIGHTFCGLPTAPARVGLVELEMPWQSVQARLRSLDPSRSDLARVSILCEPPNAVRAREAESQAALIAFCRRHQLDVLVLDPFNRLHDDDENSNSDMGHVLEGLHEVRRRTGVAMVVLHHVRKLPAGGPAAPHSRTVALDAGRGSSRLTNDPATVLALDETKGFVRLTFAKVRHAEAPQPLYLKRNERGFFDVAEDPTLVKVRRVDELQAMLEQAGPQGVSVEEVAARLGVSAQTVRRDLKDIGATQFGDNRRAIRWAMPGVNGPASQPFDSDDELPL